MKRLDGLDIARALSILGMMLVNYKLVFAVQEPEWVLRLMGLLEGRASAVFVMLSGIGLGLMSRKARESGEPEQRRKVRTVLVKRACFLWALGLLLYGVFDWTADILHYYGAFMLLMLPVLFWNVRRLSILLFGILGVAGTLQLLFPYERGWDFEALSYPDFWTPGGFMRHLLFNGFHPVFPWLAFMVLGLMLSHGRLGDYSGQRRMIGWGLGIAAASELLSLLLRTALRHTDAVYLVATKPMPPNPLYMLAASGWAAAFIGGCLLLHVRCVKSGKPRPLGLLNAMKLTGRMALTHYVAHSAVVLSVLYALGALHRQSAWFVAGLSAGAYVLMVAGSVRWLRFRQRGPIELVMRKWSG